MKVKIKQSVLIDALNKGAVAALSDEAQGDTSNMSLLIKSIKITASKKLIIESSTSMVGVKYTLEASKDDGIVIEDPGCVLIPAKEFVGWVKAQHESATIGMSLSELATPEIINPLESLDSSDNSDNDEDMTIKKIGSVKLVAKDLSKTGTRWELDCYDPSQRKMVNFNEKSDKYFDIEAKQLADGLNKITFSALDKDYLHVLDSISIQTYNNGLYFATTDMKRCALYKIPDSSVSNLDLKNPLLIPVSLLELTSKISKEDHTLSFHYNESLERVFVSQPNLEIRLGCAEKENVKKFPVVKKLFSKDYTLLTEIPKDTLNRSLINASLVNSSSALFDFTNGKLKQLVVKAISDQSKYKPSVSSSPVESLSQETKAIWGVTHLLEVLQKMKSKNIQLYIPDNNSSVKISGEDDQNFSYFAMVIENPKYKTDDS